MFFSRDLILKGKNGGIACLSFFLNFKFRGGYFPPKGPERTLVVMSFEM